MYSEQDMQDVRALLKQRRLITLVPAALVWVAAIAVFIYGRIQHSETLWMVTTALTIVGGVYFIFMSGVFVRPVKVYRKHVDYMLNGRMRETSGVYKSFADAVSDREGLECHALFVNVGDKDDPEDDRLLYYDAQKPKPEVAFGERVRVLSNDKMIASFERA